MSGPRAQRRLAAILAADVVGYAHLMEQDEAGTLAPLEARRHHILVPVVSQHNGRIVKAMGDGAGVEFGSAVDAVQCAVELQKGFTEANQAVPETCLGGHFPTHIPAYVDDSIRERFPVRQPRELTPSLAQ